MKTQKIKETK